MPDYVEYFLNSESGVVQYETLEIRHPSFSKGYRIVRNATAGVWLTNELGQVWFYEYYPLKITGNEVRENMDFGITVELGDLGEIIPKELDAVAQADAFQTKPSVIYRTYRSDDRSAPIYGPINLEITSFAFKGEGCIFEAKAPALNVNGTGETYKFGQFPMLRGFV